MGTIYTCLHCYESTLGSSKQAHNSFKDFSGAANLISHQEYTQTCKILHYHISCSLFLLLLLLLLLFTVLITLELTEEDVGVPVKKCSNHLPNRSVHSCIYCTLLFTIPDAFNILKNRTTECSMEPKFPPYLLANCTVFICHLRNE